MQVLAPAVQYGDEADLGAQVTRIDGDLAQGFGRRLEQDGIDPRLVLEGDFGDRRRHGEDDVEIGHRQQLGLPLNQPCGLRPPLAFRAMPVAARIVGDADQATLRATLDMTAERCRAASLYRPMTRRSVRPRWPACAWRNASPWRRKISATSSAGMTADVQVGAAPSILSRSKGLAVLPIVVLATWVYRAVVDRS